MKHYTTNLTNAQIDRLIVSLGDFMSYSRRARRGAWAQAWAWATGAL